MTLPRAFFPFLTWTAMMMLLHCTADRLPPPTGLSFKWLDPFTVNVSWSWQMPSDLPKGCEIKFQYTFEGDKTETKRTESRHIIENCLTKESGSHTCMYTVQAVMDGQGANSCQNWTSGPSENITVFHEKQGKVVDNFRCVVDNSGLNCSWIPVDPSQNLTLTHRTCGSTKESRNSSRGGCGQYYRSGKRNGCYLEVSVVPPPKLNITHAQHELKLTWKIPEVQNRCWKYQFNYTECNKPMSDSWTIEKVNFFTIHYDENCLYEIQSRVVSDEKICPVINSDWSDVVTYGSNQPHETLTVVAIIIIPIMLFICVILHINILCPIIPDPSAIFKEMMMNGNKDQRPGNLYTPVPEPVEPCKVTLVTENCILH
ncbi:hypothetical protein INR49_027977 [Caranx melampygus]|nr:hypothetical protein INR49_027977 [Caranx melampygus]